MKWIPIAKKDLKILFKDPGAIVVLFLLPIMFISVMSFALMPVYNGEDKGIGLLVIDQDESKESNDFIDALNDIEGITVVKENNKADALEITRTKIQNGKYPMLLVIPDNFSEKVLANEHVELLEYKDPAQLNTNSVIGKAIEGVAQKYSVEFIIGSLVDDQIISIEEVVTREIGRVEAMYQTQIEVIVGEQSLSEVPVISNKNENINIDDLKMDLVSRTKQSLENPLIHLKSIAEGDKTPEPDSFQQNVPGYTVMFAFFIVMFAGRSFINEKNAGTFDRIHAAPISMFELYIGKLVPNLLLGIMQVFIMFSIGHFIFGMSLGSSPLGLICISIALAWASSSLGMLIASIGKSESQITGLSLMLVLTLAALGGTMVPLFIMPDIMKKIAFITPHAWALSGYQDILVRNLGLQDIIVNILVLISFGLLFLAISLFRLQQLFNR